MRVEKHLTTIKHFNAVGKTGRPFWRLVNIEDFVSVDTKSSPTTSRD